MKIYLINLDKDVDRLAAATKQLSAQGLAFERVAAVYGKSLSEEEKKTAVRKWRWRLAVGRNVRDGEIGCALSHYAVLRHLGGGVCCVLEDDVILRSGFNVVLSEVEKWMDPSRPQVVLLSDHDYCGNTKHEILPTDHGMFAEAYVLTAPAARALLKANFPLSAPCDHWTRWVRMGIIELYHAYPATCNQNWTGYDSNIGQSGVKVPVRPLLERVARHLGFLLDNILLMSGRLLRGVVK